jgi:GPH family glycoside/pentoside/hexuronide:cation symporter
MSQQDPKTSLAVRWGFALAGLGSLAGSQIVSVLGLRFMTDNLAISAAVAGSLFALIQVWDGIVHPLVGYVSDRTSSPWGRRLPFLMAGSILLPLAVLGLFAPPALPSPHWMAAFMALMLMVHGVGYSLTLVPLYSMSAEVSDDYHERSRIIAYRTNGGYAAGILGSTVPPFLLVLWSTSRGGYARMGLAVAALYMAIGVAGALLMRGVRASRPQGHAGTSLLGQARMAWGNKPFRILMLAHVVFMIGVATTMSSVAYFNRYVTHRDDTWLGTFYMLLTVSNIAGTPLWTWLSKRWDKKPAYCLSLVFYGLGIGAYYFCGPQDSYTSLVIRVVALGVTMSGVPVLAFSMLADAMRYDFIQTGHRREGAYSGFVSLVDKLSGAIGLALMGFLLAKMGYTSSTRGAGALQSDQAIWAVRMSFAVIPFLTAMLSLGIMAFYRLRESDLVETPDAAPADVVAADLTA